MIELNIIDNIHKINWINKRIEGKENFIESLGTPEDKQVIKDALLFAEDKGLIIKVIKRYNKSI